MSPNERGRWLPLGILLMFAATPALSQGNGQQPIDADLRGQLDFRDVAFESCFGQQQCFAQGVTITAERRAADGLEWIAAELYWDPLDGFGVMGGGQNDEIDFDERILVTFEGTKEGTVNVERVWLSDIFIGEDQRYGTIDPAGAPDVETAVIQSTFANEVVAEVIVDGLNLLPPDPFNAEVVPGFQEDGDLFRRIVIRDDVIAVVVPSDGATEEQELLSFRITEVDEDKLGLFEGVETVEIDLAEILAGFNDVPFYVGGTVNAEIIADLLDNPATLRGLSDDAAENRVVSSVSNGELGADLDSTVDVETLVFMSVLGGSNDYSVAGIVMPE